MCERRRDKLAWSSRSEYITTSEASAFEASLFRSLNYFNWASTSANTITLKKEIDYFTEIWVSSIRREVGAVKRSRQSKWDYKINTSDFLHFSPQQPTFLWFWNRKVLVIRALYFYIEHASGKGFFQNILSTLKHIYPK